MGEYSDYFDEPDTSHLFEQTEPEPVPPEPATPTAYEPFSEVNHREARLIVESFIRARLAKNLEPSLWQNDRLRRIWHGVPTGPTLMHSISWIGRPRRK